ncbi:unnamed protein product [Thlaspi arvense]|uniref:Smr domain-containing protein n=1 Tax=Thlaspi arvense TaxID=13288 RepID=A0AAU9SCR2_THLAR|nr:unnamed protein product [Thlaspi arvense]
MASTPPHWSVFTVNNHRQTRQQPNSNYRPWLPQRVSSSPRGGRAVTSAPPSSSSSVSAATVSSGTLSKTPTFSPLQTPKPGLSSDFSGRRSTRFVSKMHFGRPKTTMASRHSSAAEDALQNRRLLRVRGKVAIAKSVFETALACGYGNTVYAFSALISAYGRSGLHEEAISVFNSMKSYGLRPNLVTYNAAVKEEWSLSEGGLWETARSLFDEMLNRGIEQDVFSYNTLLDAICKGGQMDLAFDILAQMPSKRIMPNVVSYSTVIDGFAKAGRYDEALNLFDEMRYLGTALDRVSYNTLLSIYTKVGRSEEALDIFREMATAGIKKDVVTYNDLLGGYGKQGKYVEVKNVFAEMKREHVRPNLLTYSTLMDVYSKGGLYKEAMEIFKEFKSVGLRADVVLYSALIDALCKNGLVGSAVSLIDEMAKEGIRPNIVTYNSIIDAYGRSATMESLAEPSSLEVGFSSSPPPSSSLSETEDNRVMQIFEQLTTESNNRMKKDCEEGMYELSCILEVIRKMNQQEIKPNVVTFSAILNACSRCNSLEDASMLLEELRVFDNQVYGVVHGLLMGHRENVWLQAQSLFDKVKEMDGSTASAFYNALTDMLWHFGQKRGAQLVALDGRSRQVWENVWSNSCLDLHLMSSGAARAMVHAWLLNIRSIVYEGHELPKHMSILTGWGKHSKVVGDGALRRAVETLLRGMDAPFHLSRCNMGRFTSSGTVVATWLRESATLKLLVLHDHITTRANITMRSADQPEQTALTLQLLPL